ncbi:gluconate permease [Klebsiella variicola]|uniref:Gluconate permease n=1 Tax=Klebsiella variicola TaxID=244366 RepID=A0A7H4MJQ7_KLEVA|nr:gluconate permease [Klebsiella variicola]
MALLIVSLLVAFATGIPADKIITTIEKGMGGLLGHIASIIILGSMLGVLIEMSGRRRIAGENVDRRTGRKTDHCRLNHRGFYSRHAGLF